MAMSWWGNEDTPRIGFTHFAEEQTKSAIDVDCDEITARVLQARADMLATARAIRESRAVGVIRRAVVVSNN